MDGIALGFGIIIGAGVMGLVWYAVQTTRQLVEVQKRLAVLEQTARTRMPHEAKAELMDALAVIEHTLEERHIDEVFLSNIAGHINNAIEVGSTRQGRAGQ